MKSSSPATVSVQSHKNNLDKLSLSNSFPAPYFLSLPLMSVLAATWFVNSFLCSLYTTLTGTGMTNTYVNSSCLIQLTVRTITWTCKVACILCKNIGPVPVLLNLTDSGSTKVSYRRQEKFWKTLIPRSCLAAVFRLHSDVTGSKHLSSGSLAVMSSFIDHSVPVAPIIPMLQHALHVCNLVCFALVVLARILYSFFYLES